MLLKLVPAETHIGFLGYRKIAAVFSALLIVVSMVLFFVQDLNYGIDFKGGISMEIGMPGETVEQRAQIPVDTVRSVLAGMDLGDAQVQPYSTGSEALIRIERQPGDSKAQTEAISRVRAALAAAIPEVTFRQEDVVTPKVSGELKEKGSIAVIVAVFAVLVYIWFRFEWQFGMGAVVALVHDVLLTIGFFAVTGLEFNLSIIAAILTIVGYSLNDTVVVYDRIRENIRRYRKKELPEIIDLSLNQTLSRTVMTSVTTLVALVALYVFGVEQIRGFTAAMIWGVVVGTYSSVFVAAPVLTALNVRRESFYELEDQKDPTVDKTRGGHPFEHMP